MSTNSAAAAIAALSLALFGCAGIMGGSQDVSVTTPPANGAKCVLSNNEGSWTVMSPGVVSIETGDEDLHVRCAKPGYGEAAETVPPDSGLLMLGSGYPGTISVPLTTGDLYIPYIPYPNTAPAPH